MGLLIFAAYPKGKKGHPDQKVHEVSLRLDAIESADSMANGMCRVTMDSGNQHIIAMENEAFVTHFMGVLKQSMERAQAESESPSIVVPVPRPA
jgi:hypothetical protein